MTLADSAAKHRPPRHRQSESAFCPFCPGNEWDTPDEVMSVVEHDQWQLRVVPNKYPAVNATDDGGIFGIHDVVIPCREHETNPSRLTITQFSRMIRAWRDRLRVIACDERLAHATVFMNVGAEAGASLDHLHAQILAVPFVPNVIRGEIDGLLENRHESGVCLFCQSNDSVITRLHGMTVVCPWASRFAYETWVIPDGHSPHFDQISDFECDQLAAVLRSTVNAIDSVLHEPAFNLFIHTAPFRSTEDYHWHLEIIPRTARAAGFEWGSGVFINTAVPEEAAKQLAAAITEN